MNHSCRTKNTSRADRPPYNQYPVKQGNGQRQGNSSEIYYTKRSQQTTGALMRAPGFELPRPKKHHVDAGNPHVALTCSSFQALPKIWAVVKAACFFTSSTKSWDRFAMACAMAFSAFLSVTARRARSMKSKPKPSRICRHRTASLRLWRRYRRC